LPLAIYPNRFCPSQFTPPGFTLADLTQKNDTMKAEPILHQSSDFAWQVRAGDHGGLLACITWDDNSGNYYVSAGMDLESEHFRTFREAVDYALGGAL
jgi:hypothetical protein